MLETIMKNMEMVRCEFNCQNHSNMMVMCMNICESLEQCEKKAKRLNERERMFCLQETDYNCIQCWMTEMRMYKCCWCTINSWYCCQDQWRNCPIENVDCACIQKKVEEMCCSMNLCMREMGNEKMVQVCMEIKNEIEKFRNCMPMLCLLGVPGMQARHWKLIEEKTKIRVNPQCCLQNCVDLGLMEYM